jgi:hypothetical protein
MSTVMNLLDSGPGSLRDAIAAGGTVSFQPGLAGIIQLQSTLAINQSVNIVGPGSGLIMVSGQNATEVFYTGVNITASISGLRIGDGFALNGGGVFNNFGSNLTLTDCWLTGNRVTSGGNGGAIFNRGVLTLHESIIEGSSAPTNGIGVGVYSNGTLSATNCTIISNAGASFGGGLFLTGTATLINCTVTGNEAESGVSASGGGMYLDAGSTVHLVNTIVAQNASSLAGDDIMCATGTVPSADHCLIGIGEGSNVVNGTSGNQVGTIADPINPLLQGLQNNGGPTLTDALLPGSPAIDAGTATGAPLIDQRGYARPAGAGFDIGAFEYQGSSTGQPIFVVGSDAGGPPQVKIYDAHTGQLKFQFFAFDPTFKGGVRAAVGDVNGDGVRDVVVASGPGGPPLVKVIDGTKLNQTQANGEIADTALLASFDAYDPSFLGGVNVAVGKVDADNDQDVITGAGAGGGPHVKVIDGDKLTQIQANGEIANSALLAGFYAYAPEFAGGVNVAAADVNGDGIADIITGAGPGGGPHVKVIDGTKLGQLRTDAEIADSALLGSFYAYAPAFSGGVYVAAGDLNGDGHADIVTGAGAGSGPHVKAIDGSKLGQLQFDSEPANGALLASFFAYDPAFNGGVRVAVGVANSANALDIITGAGPGGGPHVKAFSSPSLSMLDSFYAYDPTFAGGVFVGGGS